MTKKERHSDSNREEEWVGSRISKSKGLFNPNIKAGFHASLDLVLFWRPILTGLPSR